MRGGISTRAIAEKYETTQGLFNKWLRNYREYGIESLISKTGRKKGGTKGQGRKPKTELEKLKYDLLKKEIEVMRLKKGYAVKGVGAKKEYVTTFDVNTK
ncbi:MAG: helix-turn-helix domain-containing protein [Tissierellia bacterium]|nr:helix-turn-helix domain-containing protein [Tissierellia bacterium]